ncbi:diguanylate cyclase [Marinospirillum sp.]|uniref:diguanylate cyclase n=1 Tax=Marinospirillum sp. TaxID=2183934 RepID=UPI00384ADAA7
MLLRVFKLSFPLLLMILLPALGGLFMFVLVLIGFEAARGVAVKEQENKMQQLVTTTASSIEKLWVAPRENVVIALASSDTLNQRIRDEVAFDDLFQEWKVSNQVLEGYFFIYYGLRDGTIEYYPEGELPPGYDPRNRPWYTAGMQIDKSVAWTSPYKEAITEEMVVSTVTPLYRGEEKIGVLSTDMKFEGLTRILEEMQLPPGSSVFLVNEKGVPFIGTDEECVETGKLPEVNETLFVGSSPPLSNGWQVSIVVPRTAIAESFSQLRRPIFITSALLLLAGVIIISLLVGRAASRVHHLANYFREVQKGSVTPRQIFPGKDEFSFLNSQFNQVIAEARKAEEKKLAQERTFRFLVEQTPVGFFRTSWDGELLYINPYAASLMGYTQNEALKEISSVDQFYYDKKDRDSFLEELLEQGEVRNRKILFVRRSGETIWISMTARLNRKVREHDEKDASEIEGFVMDITSDMEERDSLINMTESDPLTGAANRRAFDEAINNIVKLARLSGQSVTLILFDIDKFKPINDNYGHDVGDYLLREIVSVVNKHIRGGDLLARMGGDEFAILLPLGSGKGEAEGLMHRLQDEIKDIVLPESLPEPPTLSIGVGIVRGDDAEAAELYKVADTAMYRAKKTGRNRIHFSMP